MNIKNIPALLKEERKRRSMTQGNVAELLNMDISTISLYESGKRAFPIDLLDRWLSIFNMTMAVLDTQNENKTALPKPVYDRFQELKAEKKKLITSARQLCYKILKCNMPDERGNRDFIGYGDMLALAMVEDLLYGGIIVYYDKFIMNGTGRAFGLDIGVYYEDGVKKEDPLWIDDDYFFGDQLYREIPLEKISHMCEEDSNKRKNLIMYLDQFEEIEVGKADLLPLDTLLCLPERLHGYYNAMKAFNKSIERESFEYQIKEIDREMVDILDKWKLTNAEPRPELIPWGVKDEEEIEWLDQYEDTAIDLDQDYLKQIIEDYVTSKDFAEKQLAELEAKLKREQREQELLEERRLMEEYLRERDKDNTQRKMLGKPENVATENKEEE